MTTFSFSGTSSILSADFYPPIELKDDTYVLGLINFESFNSIPNIDNDNNAISIDGETITIPVGSYEINDINECIQSALKKGIS